MEISELMDALSNIIMEEELPFEVSPDGRELVPTCKHIELEGNVERLSNALKRKGVLLPPSFFYNHVQDYLPVKLLSTISRGDVRECECDIIIPEFIKSIYKLAKKNNLPFKVDSSGTVLVPTCNYSEVENNVLDLYAMLGSENYLIRDYMPEDFFDKHVRGYTELCHDLNFLMDVGDIDNELDELTKDGVDDIEEYKQNLEQKELHYNPIHFVLHTLNEMGVAEALRFRREKTLPDNGIKLVNTKCKFVVRYSSVQRGQQNET